MKTRMIGKEKPVIESREMCPVCGCRKWHPMEVNTRGQIKYRKIEPLIAVVDFTEGDPREADECVSCGTVVV